jgi:hypothetical protein
MICNGEILGVLKDPQGYFDSPETEERLGCMCIQTTLLSRVVNAKAGVAENEAKNSGGHDEEKGPRVRTDFGSAYPQAKRTREPKST